MSHRARLFGKFERRMHELGSGVAMLCSTRGRGGIPPLLAPDNFTHLAFFALMQRNTLHSFVIYKTIQNIIFKYGLVNVGISNKCSYLWVASKWEESRLTLRTANIRSYALSREV